MSGRHRHFDLLEDQDVRRWYNNVKEGSQTTADTSIRRLGLFCEYVNMTPKELLKLNEKERNDLLVDFISDFRNHDGKERSGTYLQSLVKPVRSWYLFNGIQITRKIKIKGTNSRPSLKNERVPTQDELKGIFLAGDTRERLACSIMAFSGVRPQVLGNYRGTEGLRISDIPDMEIRDGIVSFSRIPVRIIIRSELSKKENEYFSFIGNEGANYLKRYIEERIQQGETIKPESPVIAPAKKGIRTKVNFITTTNIGDLIRNTIRRSGLNQRPYVLRKYFDTQLLQAESKTNLKRDYRVFWMGHTGDMEHEYTLNHGLLPESVIEDMREQYAKASKFLETEQKGMSEEDIDKKFRLQLLLMAGFKEYEIKEKNLLNMTQEEITSLARERLFGGILNKEDVISEIRKQKKTMKQGSQKVIPISLLESYINEGFTVKMAIGNDKAIVELP